MIIKTKHIKDHFKKELKAENFVVDRTGAKTIEMLGASFLADEPAIFGEPNEEYIKDEITVTYPLGRKLIARKAMRWFVKITTSH